MKNLRFYFLTLASVPLLLSCNAYSPLNSTKTIEDHLQEAQKCLRDSDYGCAIDQYNALPDGALKSEKLCMVYLSKGGLTLDTLINKLNKPDLTVVGKVAQSLVPWSATKSSDLDSAKTNCVAFAATTGSGNQGTLLKTIALLTHCAIRLTKTDTLLGTSNSDTTCTTAGNGNGTISTADLGPSSGSISTSSPGMCAADVTSCVSDISSVTSSSLSLAGLGNLQTAFDAFPAELKDTSTGTDVSRSKLQTLIP